MSSPRVRFWRPWTNLLVGCGSGCERLVLTVLAMAAIGLACFLWWSVIRLRDSNDHLRAQAAVLRLARLAKPAAVPLRFMPLEVRRQIEKVATQLNTPWSDIFDALERVTNERVALVSLEPNPVGKAIAITAEARSLSDLLAYADALANDGAIGEVRLAHHETNAQDPNLPVRLSFVLSLRVSGAKASPS